MLAVSGFLIPSSDTQALTKTKHSGLCTVDQIWVCHTFLGHHLQEESKRTTGLQIFCLVIPSLYTSSCPLQALLLPAATIRCSHSSGSEKSCFNSIDASVIMAIGYSYYHSRDSNMVTLTGRIHSAIKRHVLLLLLLMGATHRYQHQNRSLSEHNYSPNCEIH